MSRDDNLPPGVTVADLEDQIDIDEVITEIGAQWADAEDGSGSTSILVSLIERDGHCHFEIEIDGVDVPLIVEREEFKREIAELHSMLKEL